MWGGRGGGGGRVIPVLVVTHWRGGTIVGSGTRPTNIHCIDRMHDKIREKSVDKMYVRTKRRMYEIKGVCVCVPDITSYA